MHVATCVGRRLLKGISPEGWGYASERQFEIVPKATAKGWCLCHLSDARNLTFLNGSPVAVDGVTLSNGDEISIGGLYALVVVSLDDA